MTIEDIIAQIRPGATLYAVLLAFAIGAFRYAQELRAGESRIYQEFLERVRSIRETFQRRYLEPIVGKVLDDSVEGARGAAFQSIRAAFQIAAYPLDQAGATALIDQTVAALAAQPSPGEAFLTSHDGTAFMEQLELRQQRRQRMIASYDGLKRQMRNGYSSFFALSVLFLLGLLRVVFDIPPYIVVTFVNAVALLLAFGIYSVVKMFREETALRDNFERLAFYAEEL